MELLSKKRKLFSVAREEKNSGKIKRNMIKCSQYFGMKKSFLNCISSDLPFFFSNSLGEISRNFWKFPPPGIIFHDLERGRQTAGPGVPILIDSKQFKGQFSSSRQEISSKVSKPWLNADLKQQIGSARWKQNAKNQERPKRLQISASSSFKARLFSSHFRKFNLFFANSA